MTLLLAWLLADFFAGLVHWAQDTLLDRPSRFKSLDTIRLDNDWHHDKPHELGNYPFHSNIRSAAIIAWPLVLILFLADAPTIIWLSLFFASLGNGIHKYSHVPKRKLHPLVKFMQRTGLFISQYQHGRHHYSAGKVIGKKDASVCYCPMTSWLNPVLDWFGFFPMLTRIFGR